MPSHIEGKKQQRRRGRSVRGEGEVIIAGGTEVGGGGVGGMNLAKNFNSQQINSLVEN